MTILEKRSNVKTKCRNCLKEKKNNEDKKEGRKKGALGRNITAAEEEEYQKDDFVRKVDKEWCMIRSC